MRSTIDFLYRLFHLDDQTAAQRLDVSLSLLRQELRENMTVIKGQFDSLLAAMNTETNTLSARLDALQQKLADALANGDRSMTAAETTAVFAEMQAISTRLLALGADPVNPVPPVDPNPPVPATAG